MIAETPPGSTGLHAPRAIVTARGGCGLTGPAAVASAFQIAVPANAVLFGFFLALTVATALATDRRTGAQRRRCRAPARCAPA